VLGALSQAPTLRQCRDRHPVQCCSRNTRLHWNPSIVRLWLHHKYDIIKAFKQSPGFVSEVTCAGRAVKRHR